MINKKPRVAVLWTHASGYLEASLSALKDTGCEVFLSSYKSDLDAPFDEDLFNWLNKSNKFICSKPIRIKFIFNLRDCFIYFFFKTHTSVHFQSKSH